MNFYSLFRSDGSVIKGVCVKALGWNGLFASIGAQTKGEGEYRR